MPEPSTEPLEEVRVAMALNGGVSLAVWMGGCAVELDCARRAHAGREDVGSLKAPQPLKRRAIELATADRAPAAVAAERIPQRGVYHALCTAFQRRLVVDLMSGASAGGINGALLAGAITHRRRLHPDFIRAQWVVLGDFSKLLHRARTPRPTSLMRGDMFHESLEKAFEELLEGDDDHCRVPASQAAVEAGEVKLDVTTTDVLGEERRFRDAWGGTLRAREFRARFEFRDTERHYTPALLAQAARSTASFPFAFEPWRTREGSQLLAGFQQERWVVDGGLLDNAPIRATLDLIPMQPAAAEVQRYVCYVNADPEGEPLDGLRDEEPDLRSIIGYVASLPRKAPFVDQLQAIVGATQRSIVNREDELLRLVTLPADTLEATASALLPAYARRRRLTSIEEIVRLRPQAPADAVAAFEHLGDRELPWIPDAFPPAAGGWRWGFRAAQRILHLQIDLLRATIDRLPVADRAPLLTARQAVDAEIQDLEAARTHFLASPRLQDCIGALAAPDPDVQGILEALGEEVHADAIAGRVRTATEAFFGVATQMAQRLGPELPAALFGERHAAGELGDDAHRTFLVRALGIEVVRRAFSDEADIESSQKLRFAQLTPQTPSPLFATEERPEGWATAADKLTGIELGHFAGFYRRSWRVNDFMWGRLDAAARIVDMLVDPARAADLHDHGGTPAWTRLAAGLLPDDAGADLRAAIHAALGGTGDAPAAAALRGTLAERLEADLRGPSGRGHLTRDVCTRAVHLEILAHELPILVAESREDAKLGSGSAALSLPLDAGLLHAVADLRDAEPLPLRLGRDEEEVGSALALRTITHAALVFLAMLRGGGVPLANVVYGLRAGLLPIAGVVARSHVYRLGAVLGFWAVSMFLAERMLSPVEEGPIAVSLLWSAHTIAALVAVLVLVGYLLVPGVRVRPPGWRRRLVQGAVLAALLAVAGGIAVVCRLLDAGWAQVLLAPGDHPQPDWLLGAMSILLAGPVLARFVPGAPDLIAAVSDSPWGGRLTFAALMVAGALLVHYSWAPVRDVAGEGGVRAVAAWGALAGAPLLMLAYAFAPPGLRRVGL